jgi:hypothetical protein
MSLLGDTNPLAHHVNVNTSITKLLANQDTSDQSLATSLHHSPMVSLRHSEHANNSVPIILIVQGQVQDHQVEATTMAAQHSHTCHTNTPDHHV